MVNTGRYVAIIVTSLVSWAGAGCGDDGTTTDSGPGAVRDGGGELDGGPVGTDSGRTDAGAATDAGARDSGLVVDAHEPAGFEPITQRPFDAADEDGWGDPGSGEPNWAIESDATAPFSPTSVLTITYPAGLEAGLAPASSYYEGAFAPQARHDVYVSFWLTHSENWQGHMSGVNKILFIGDTTGGTGSGGQVYFSAQGSGSGPLAFQVRTQGAEAHNLGRNLGSAGDDILERGAWRHVEVLLRANDSGVANGEVHVWIDGVKTHEYTSEELFESEAVGRFNRLVLGATWGGVGGPNVAEDMFRRYDHFYMSGAD